MHYMNGVEHVPPSLRVSLELELERVQRWVVGRLRSAVWEVHLALRREKTCARKSEGVCVYVCERECVCVCVCLCL